MITGTTPADRSKLGLIRDVVDRFGEVRVRATGSSMLPSVWPGDVLTIRRSGVAETHLGEIAVFTRDDRLFAHRVVARSEREIVTQGDTVPSQDAPVGDADLLGVVTTVLRNGRLVTLSRRPAASSRLVSAVVRRSSHANRLLQRAHALSVQISEFRVQ